MRKGIIFIVLIALLTVPVSALEITAPLVPESGRELMPESTDTFGDGLLQILQDAVGFFRPDLAEAAKTCVCVICVIMTVSVMQIFSGASKYAANLVGSIAIAGILLNAANSLIQLGVQTVGEISEYGKMLLPVMTAALAAQGGVTKSAALYTGTAVFDTILSSLVSKLLTPMIYLYLALAVANCATGEAVLMRLRDTIKSVLTWVLKTLLYIYTGYISITGVISGTTDAAALKAAKLTISGVVPVVGGILSDASEAVLVSAGTVKNAAGVYGLLAVLSVWIGPFLQIGAHYLMIKLTAGLCNVIGEKRMVDLIEVFSSAMGLLLAMTGAVCLMLIISTVCFMKGVG